MKYRLKYAKENDIFPYLYIVMLSFRQIYKLK